MVSDFYRFSLFAKDAIDKHNLNMTICFQAIGRFKILNISYCDYLLFLFTWIYRYKSIILYNASWL
jgi:hypothetical protein